MRRAFSFCDELTEQFSLLFLPFLSLILLSSILASLIDLCIPLFYGICLSHFFTSFLLSGGIAYIVTFSS